MEEKKKLVVLGLGKVEITLNDSGKVIDFATGVTLKDLSKNPEESVRQWYEHVLIEEFGYEANQMGIEIPIQMGSTTKKADIVVYETPAKKKKLIIVETKKPNKKEGVTQLQSYLDATGVEFGVWTNGYDISHWYHDAPQSFEPIGRLVRAGETVDDIGLTLTRKELLPAKDLVSDFRAAEQFILSHQGGVDVFDEIFKLIFTKIYDEKRNLKTLESETSFRAGVKEPPSRVKKRISELFEGAKGLYPDVFIGSEKIELNGQVTKWVVMLLQNYILAETDMDVLGTGFEILVNPKMKSDKGQYFTPRQVVRAAVEMIRPNENMRIVDPACGSGGFLIYSMEHVWKKIDEEWASELDALAEKLAFAQTNIFGADYDDRLVRVAKAYMAIWGDGRTHIYHVPCSIKSYEWQGEIADKLADGTFDALLTNPPFAGDLELQNIAHHFDLGKKGDRELDSQRKDILFIERALRLVKPSSIDEHSGLIAIVLPKGDLDEREKQYVRDYILNNAMVLAVISLHPFSFVPFTQQKTALVIMKRMPPEEIPEDYDIYMAVSGRPGKNKSGSLIYMTDEEGIVLDKYNRPKLDTDLYEIAKEFIEDNPNIGYKVKRSELVGRLNAEYYHPKYMEVRSKVTRGTYVYLRDILDSEKGMANGKDLSSISSDGKRHYSETGLPYLRVGDVKENEIDLVGAERIDAADYIATSLPKSRVNDLLLTRKGTTGRAAVVSENEVQAVLSSEIIRIRLKKSIHIPDRGMISINPYYVAAYLNSDYGKSLILQKQTGGISEGINHPDLKDIEIPIPSQEEMDAVAEEYRESNRMLIEARKTINELPSKLRKIIG